MNIILEQELIKTLGGQEIDPLDELHLIEFGCPWCGDTELQEQRTPSMFVCMSCEGTYSRDDRSWWFIPDADQPLGATMAHITYRHGDGVQAWKVWPTGDEFNPYPSPEMFLHADEAILWSMMGEETTR